MISIRARQIIDRVWGPVVAIIINLLLIAALIKYVAFDSKEKQADIEVTMVDAVETDLDEFNDQLEQLDEIEDMPEVDMPNEFNMEIDAPVVDSVTPAPVDAVSDFSELSVGDVSSPLVMKGLFAGRSSSGRKASLGKYGGRWGQFTEKAVLKSLRWLKTQQRPDGSWEKNADAMTGLALLAFLAHGETPSSQEFGETVSKAIRFLAGRIQENGQIGGGGHKVYPHAMATYALAEAYALTRIPSIKPGLTRAVKLIVESQGPSGLWDYDWKKGPRMDTSVSGWMIQALKAAYLAGIHVPGLKETLDKGIAGLKRDMYNKETGAFGYTGIQGRNDSMTGVATLCLELVGDGESREAKGGIKALNVVECNWQKPIQSPIYAWYYITQAKFHAGGNTWSSWNNKFAKQYIEHQSDDGHWDFPTKETGSGEGPVYSTTLCALTLMVYYRHLPSYKHTENAAPKTAPKKSSDEITISIF